MRKHKESPTKDDVYIQRDYLERKFFGNNGDTPSK